MTNTFLPYYIYIFQVLKVCLIKIYKTESPDLLLVVFISFYYTAQQISFFTKFYHIICKNNFHHKFSSFFDVFTQTPLSHPPFTGQNPLSMTKVFCWCSLAKNLTETSFLKANHFYVCFLLIFFSVFWLWIKIVKVKKSKNQLIECGVG